MSANEHASATAPVPFEKATGPIDVTLKNDMMFHLVMSNSKKALKGLVCSLKGLDSDTVKDVELTNTIDYSLYTTKEIILDVMVILNNDEIIDIELQMYRDCNWELRSLLYLCRSFDSIGEGEDYDMLKPTTLIAIMNNPLFPEYPEFYSKYMLLNVKNFQPYSSYLKLNVLYLNRTDLATQEDKDNMLVYWAKVFKATDWDELRSLCSNNETFEEVAKIMYNSNVQSQEKTIMEAHQKYILDKRSMENGIKKRDEKITALTAENSSLSAKLSSANTENAKLLALLRQNGISDEQIASYLSN